MSNAVAPKIRQEESIRLIGGKIPIRNLWLLMLYASDLKNLFGGNARIAIEENPEEIADLVADILCYQVERQLMRNLSYDYKHKVAIIGRVRGRIDNLYTEGHRLLDRGKVCCRFEELTVDTPRNRYVRAALEKLNSLVEKDRLKRRCKRLALNLGRMGVMQKKPVGYSGKSERFGLHDAEDRKMVAAADLAFLLALPTELSGNHQLFKPDNDQQWLRKLFEKAVAGFYTMTLDNSEWSVKAGQCFNWQTTNKTDKIDSILPRMQTDIVITNKSNHQQLIIDTKFTSLISKSQYREETLESKYIYQMYAYLRSQEDNKETSSLTSSGMFLHPSIDQDINEAVTIQGHSFRFCTVNLANETAAIKKQLQRLLLESFEGSSIAAAD